MPTLRKALVETSPLLIGGALAVIGFWLFVPDRGFPVFLVVLTFLASATRFISVFARE